MAEERPVVEEPETLSQFWPDDDRPLTANDLLRQPDDGNRYELVDGVLQVTPAPPNNHQFVVTRLTMILGMWCPTDLDVLSGPGVNLADDLHRVPDLAVIRPVPIAEEFLTEPPVLAVEVASRSTQKVDRTRKNQEYAEFGIESYCMTAGTRRPPWPPAITFSMPCGRSLSSSCRVCWSRTGTRGGRCCRARRSRRGGRGRRGRRRRTASARR